MRLSATLWLAAFVTLTACAQHPETSHAVLSPSVWPTPVVAEMNAPPTILAIDLSPAHVTAGTWWSGRIVTSTNVASVEIRWPFFTFSAPRKAPGEFDFRFHALDLPIIYHRPYTVEIVARNTPGVTTQRNVIIDFR